MKKIIYMSFSLIMVNTIALAQLKPYTIHVPNYTGGQVIVGSTIYCYSYQVNAADPNTIKMTCDPQDTGIYPPKMTIPPGGLLVTLPVPTKPPPNNGYAWVMSDVDDDYGLPQIGFGIDGTYAMVNSITYWPTPHYWGVDGTYPSLPKSYCGGPYYPGFILPDSNPNALGCENDVT